MENFRPYRWFWSLTSLVFLLIIALASASPVIYASPTLQDNAKARYVAPDGDDSNQGTLDSPWKTIQHAANNATPGMTVYVRKGVYSERVVIGVPGSAAGGFITFRNYAKEQPVVDGTGLDVPEEDPALFVIRDQSYIVIQGFELRNYRTSRTGSMTVGIDVVGTAHHIQLRSNKIHAIETNAPVGANGEGADAHGILVSGTEAPASVHHIVIDRNELYDLRLGSSEAIILEGNVEQFSITSNKIHDVNNIAIDMVGFYGNAPDPAYDQARNGVVRGNKIYNVSTKTNPSYNSYSAGGIYVDGGRNIVIERNSVSNADIGIELASELPQGSTSKVTARNNILWNNRMVGISLGGYDQERGKTEACQIINNTLYHNDTLQGGNGEVGLQYYTRKNVIKNNILVANAQSLLISNMNSESSDNVVDYNLYFASAGKGESSWSWKGTSYTGFDQYRAGTGNDAHARFANPSFVNSAKPNLHLKARSPAINRGQKLSTVGKQDYDGKPRIKNGKVDIGAYEYQSSS